MDLADTWRMAVNSLVHRRMRSWLTVLGIVIGVGAVVALVTLGTGFEASINDQLGVFGGDSVTIIAGSTSASEGPPVNEAIEAPETASAFTQREADLLGSVRGVDVLNAVVAGSAVVEFRDESARFTVSGMQPEEWAELETREILAGRMLVQGDGNVAVLSEAVVESFDNPIAVNQRIIVAGESVRVVGILESSATFGLSDLTVYMPREPARDLLGAERGSVSRMQLRVLEGADVDRVADELDTRLLALRQLRPEERDFTIITGQQVQEQVSQITGTFTAFLGAIAAIALLVGGIGIANTMFMSVLERAKQIGILKALGARNRDVMALFLVEASLLGFVGGVFGVGLGLGLAAVVTSAGVLAFGPPGTAPPPLIIEADVLIGAVVFAVLIGAAFGLMPALRAARLVPVETLRSA